MRKRPDLAERYGDEETKGGEGREEKKIEVGEEERRGEGEEKRKEVGEEEEEEEGRRGMEWKDRIGTRVGRRKILRVIFACIVSSRLAVSRHTLHCLIDNVSPSCFFLSVAETG